MDAVKDQATLLKARRDDGKTERHTAIGHGQVLERDTRWLSSRERLRCFVDRDFIRQLPRLEEADYVADPEDDFDLIIAPNTSTQTLPELVARCSNPAAPMIAFSNSMLPRADVVVRDSQATTLLAAFRSVQPIVERVSALPPLPLGYERAGLLALELCYTRNCSIEARWQPNNPDLIEYPMLLGIDNPRAVLEEMADADLLRRRFCERLHMCARCGSSRLHAREVCGACKSSHLAEEPLVHHYACAFQGPQRLFEAASGYVCPKCRKQLRHYGVDYDKPGVVIACHSCGDTLAEPDVGFTCVDCSTYTGGDAAAQRDWHHYDLLADGVAAIRSGQLPRMDVAEGMPGGCPPREFRLFVARALAVARHHNRPFTAWRATFDVENLKTQIGPRGVPQVCQFVRDLVVHKLREGDIATALPAGIAVCLPETDRAQTEALVRQVMDYIAANLQPRLKISVELLDREQIGGMLEDLG
jgi:ribosomal protein S27E